MKIETAKALCAQLSYKPGHVISCFGAGPDTQALRASIGVTIADGNGVWQSKPFDLAAINTVEEFFKELHRALTAFESHELLKNLRFRHQNVWSPYTPGDRPGEQLACSKPHDDLYFERVNAQPITQADDE